MTNKTPALRALIIVAIALLGYANLYAAPLSTAKVFSSHMVLQRGLAAPVWGWAAPGSEVTVNFADQSHTTTTADNGRWEVKLDALAASTEGRTMTISAEGMQPLSYTDILVGDVWICSGQSNMEWSVQQSGKPQEEIAAGSHPQIRLFNVLGHDIAASPTKRLVHNCAWSVCSPQSVTHFSAVGYYFGRDLQQKSGVPIGLISTNWGGTRIEPWIPPAGYHTQPELAHLARQVNSQLTTTETGKAAWEKYANDIAAWAEQMKTNLASGEHMPLQPPSPGPSSPGQPCAIYNAMVAPIVGYGVRGAIWYQGESNGGEGIHYLPKLKALVQGWRDIWAQPEDFPFYFYVVKLAQFHAANEDPRGGDGFARIRVAQDRIQELPHTGVASAIDIGHATDIHPKNKQDVGKRLARWALRDVYDQTDIVVTGPTFKAMTIEGDTATISYEHVGSGLISGQKPGYDATIETPGAELKRFAIAGEDRQWHWATATIEGDQVKVSSPAVSTPVAVRYAYSSNPEGANLYNKEGLPAIPFRTDNWNP